MPHLEQGVSSLATKSQYLWKKQATFRGNGHQSSQQVLLNQEGLPTTWSSDSVYQLEFLHPAYKRSHVFNEFTCVQLPNKRLAFIIINTDLVLSDSYTNTYKILSDFHKRSAVKIWTDTTSFRFPPLTTQCNYASILIWYKWSA
jgi:hypothetical protein